MQRFQLLFSVKRHGKFNVGGDRKSRTHAPARTKLTPQERRLRKRRLHQRLSAGSGALALFVSVIAGIAGCVVGFALLGETPLLFLLGGAAMVGTGALFAFHAAARRERARDEFQSRR